MKRLLLFLALLFPCLAVGQGISINPASTIAGATNTPLLVFGTGFAVGATVNWNGVPLSTTFGSTQELSVTLSAALLAAPGAGSVTVTQSGITSPPISFQILTPIVSTITYTPTVFTPGTGTTLNVYGGAFNSGAVIFFDWFPVSTSFVSSSNLQGSLSGSQIVGNGPHRVFVYNAPLPPGLPSLDLIQQPLQFRNISTGSNSTQIFTVTNTSATNVTLGTTYYTISGLNASDFTNPGGTGSCTNSEVLAPGAFCTVYIQFAPTANGNEIALVKLASSGVGNPQIVTVTGTGIPPAAPEIQLTPTNFAYGSIQQATSSGTISSTIKNTGNANLSITALSVTGTDAGDFATSGSCTSSTTLPPAGTCNLGAIFTPSTTGTESGAISITDNAAGSPHTISLTGTGASAVTHFVSLAWTASTSASLIGYNVYRSTVDGGPFTLLTPTPIGVTGYDDAGVTHLTQYFYCVTAVGQNPPYSPQESSFSNEASVTP